MKSSMYSERKPSRDSRKTLRAMWVLAAMILSVLVASRTLDDARCVYEYRIYARARQPSPEIRELEAWGHEVESRPRGRRSGLPGSIPPPPVDFLHEHSKWIPGGDYCACGCAFPQRKKNRVRVVEDLIAFHLVGDPSNPVTSALCVQSQRAVRRERLQNCNYARHHNGFPTAYRTRHGKSND
jgi:hypothetical protein